MGLDCSSLLIIGEKFSRELIKESVIRYDEVTGESYIRTFNKEVWERSDGSFVDLDIIDEDDIFYSGCDERVRYVGLLICETPSHRNGEPVSEVFVSNILNKRNEYLKKYNKEGNIYLITFVSF